MALRSPWPRHGADDRAAFARGRCAPVDRKARLAAGLRMRGDPNMIGTVRAVHGGIHKRRIQKAIGPPRGRARRSDFMASSRARHPGCPPRTIYRSPAAAHNQAADQICLLLAPLGAVRPVDRMVRPDNADELNVPPALIVMSLVSVASACAPLSPLICRALLPDCEIDGEGPDQTAGIRIGLAFVGAADVGRCGGRRGSGGRRLRRPALARDR